MAPETIEIKVQRLEERFMRVLHEQVISDIATLGGEARQPQGPQRARSKKQPRS
ncbi:MAG: hypothetical protein H0W53_13195 [Acidobacteria bacterium]|nr:hypothetical protein [Acidobacteriota bacterium]